MKRVRAKPARRIGCLEKLVEPHPNAAVSIAWNRSDSDPVNVHAVSVVLAAVGGYRDGRQRMRIADTRDPRAQERFARL